VGQLEAKATIELNSGSEVSTRGKKKPRAAGEPRADDVQTGGAGLQRDGKTLLAQVLERDLDALIVEFLIIAAELIAAARPAVEELTYDADGCVWFSLQHRCASNIDSPVEV